MMSRSALAVPPDHETPGSNLTVQEYHRQLELALRPMFLPLIRQWIQQRYGHDASASIRFIALEPNGVVHVHVDAEAPGRTCIFAFFYERKNGWKLVQVDNHSGSASGCH
jgi:hypothetical protein